MRIGISLILAVVLFSCQKETDISTNPPPTVAAKKELDISYGSDNRQKMDIYLPAGRKTDSTKSIVIIHGGAWNEGDKSEYSLYVDTLQKRFPGYAVFNINYRLYSAGNNLFPTQENDVKTALEFIVSKKDDYKISDKIVLLGISAGAHLSLLHAYKYPGPAKIKAVVDFFGPTDMIDMYDHPRNPLVVPLLETLLGGTPTTKTALYQQSSPVNFITPQSPPTIILQGGTDVLVDPAQSQTLATLLQAKGVTTQYVFYPTEGHGWFGTNLVHSFNAIQTFVETNVD